MTNLQTLPAALSEKAGQALDLVSDKTGFVAVRDRLHHPGGDDVVTLSEPGYRQTNTYGCGAIPGLMIVCTFDPNASLDDFRALEPSLMLADR